MYLNTEDKQLILFTEGDSGYAPVLDDSLCVAPISFIPPTKESQKVENTATYGFMTGLEVYNDLSEPEEDLVESLVVKGALSTIVGSSSVGKSMLARQLALSIANNDDIFLGFKINTDCNNVIYCSTEDTKMFWKKRLRCYDEFGEKQKTLANLQIIFGSDENHFKLLESMLKKMKIALIITDVFPDIYTGDPNNNIDVRSFLKKYKNLAHKYNTSFLLVNHIGKRTEKLAPSKNNIIGSQGYESSMRSAFELRADQFDNNKRHLCIIKQNYLPDNVKSKSFVLNLKEDLTFEFTGERTDLAFLAQTNQRVASDEDLVAQVLKLKHQGLSSRSIEKSLEEQGIIICKTKICEIIKKNAGNIIVPVHQAPIVNFNDYQLGDESLN